MLKETNQHFFWLDINHVFACRCAQVKESLAGSFQNEIKPWCKLQDRLLSVIPQTPPAQEQGTQSHVQSPLCLLKFPAPRRHFWVWREHAYVPKHLMYGFKHSSQHPFCRVWECVIFQTLLSVEMDCIRWQLALYPDNSHPHFKQTRNDSLKENLTQSGPLYILPHRPKPSLAGENIPTLKCAGQAPSSPKHPMGFCHLSINWHHHYGGETTHHEGWAREWESEPMCWLDLVEVGDAKKGGYPSLL